MSADARTCLEMIAQCFRFQHPEEFARNAVPVPTVPECYSRESVPVPTASFAEEPMGDPDARPVAWED